jgi:hypothetical protein
MASDELRAATIATANRIGANPLDLGTVFSYETGGTLNPWQKGPTTQWGQHRGLIQWGEPQRAKYGITEATPVAAQVDAAGRYLIDAGFKPGMGLLDMYSAVNAGKVGRYNASDANNGGAPGTVADKVNNQMAGHRAKAAAFLGGDFSAVMPDSTTQSGRFGTSGVEASATPAPAMIAPAPEPEADTPIDATKIIQSLMQGQGALQPAPTAPAAPPPMLPPVQRQAQPFDAAAFYALLNRKRV